MKGTTSLVTILSLLFFVLISLLTNTNAQYVVQRSTANLARTIWVPNTAYNLTTGVYPYGIALVPEGSFQNYIICYKGSNMLYKVPFFYNTLGQTALPPFNKDILTTFYGPSGFECRGILLGATDIPYVLSADAVHSKTNVYSLDVTTFAFTFQTSLTYITAAGSEFSGGYATTVSGTCSTTICASFYDNSTNPAVFKRLTLNSGSTISSLSQNFIGYELNTAVYGRTRIHSPEGDDAYFSFDSKEKILRAYSSTGLREYYLNDVFSNSVTFFPDSYLGIAGSLHWFFALQTVDGVTQGLIKGYYINPCCSTIAAPTFNVPSPTAVLYYASTNQSYCYSVTETHPNFTGSPYNFWHPCQSSDTLDIFYQDDVYPWGMCNNGSVMNDPRAIIVRTYTALDSCVQYNQQSRLFEFYGYTYPQSPDPQNRYLQAISPSQQEECGVAFSPPSVLDCQEVLAEADFLTWVTKTDTPLADSVTCPSIKKVSRSLGGGGCGGSQSFAPNNNYTVLLVDTTKPSISVTNYTWNGCNIPTNGYMVVASDSCSYSTVSLSFYDEILYESGMPCPANKTVKIINRHWKATDTCGNFNTAVQRITVVDTTAPTFTISSSSCSCAYEADNNIATTCACGFPTNVQDDCYIDPNPSVYASFSSNYVVGVCPQTITRTWTVTDACGNSASKNQTIIGS